MTLNAKSYVGPHSQGTNIRTRVNHIYFVSVSTSPGTASEDGNYKPKTQEVTFIPGDTGPKSVTVDVVDDDIVEPKEGFNVKLSSTSPGVTLGEPAKVNILDNDGKSHYFP